MGGICTARVAWLSSFPLSTDLVILAQAHGATSRVGQLGIFSQFPPFDSPAKSAVPHPRQRSDPPLAEYVGR